MDHRAQLRICHEQIAATTHVRRSRAERLKQFCNLQDVMWCLDCERFVCAIHLAARHVGHRTQVE